VTEEEAPIRPSFVAADSPVNHRFLTTAEKSARLKNMSAQMKRLNSKVTYWKSKSRKLIELSKEDEDLVMETLDDKGLNFTPETQQLLEEKGLNIAMLKNQLQNMERAPQGRRWDPDVIRACILIRASSPSTFDKLGKSGLILLPSNRTLKAYSPRKDSVKQGLVFQGGKLTAHFFRQHFFGIFQYLPLKEIHFRHSHRFTLLLLSATICTV